MDEKECNAKSFIEDCVSCECYWNSNCNGK